MGATNKGIGMDLIVKSIGVCFAQPNDKKKPPKVVIAYKCGEGTNSIKFLFIKPPAKVITDRGSFLSAIAKAEGVKNVTYMDSCDMPKDIYVCRESQGAVVDIVERNYAQNCYCTGFMEMFAMSLKFSVAHSGEYPKFDKPFDLKIEAGLDAEYAKDSYEYAIINAYNACLLGCVLEREELQLETRSGEKVTFEFRQSNPSFMVQDKLYIYPVFRGISTCIDYYETEEFRYIDGDMHKVKYRIMYTNKLNDYNLIRE
jgi:hypothetical protein